MAVGPSFLCSVFSAGKLNDELDRSRFQASYFDALIYTAKIITLIRTLEWQRICIFDLHKFQAKSEAACLFQEINAISKTKY